MHSLPVSRHFLFVTVSSVAVHVVRCLEIVVINIAFLSRWKLTFIRNNFLSNHLFVLFLFNQISWIQLNKVYGKLHPTHFLNNSPSLPKPFCIFSIPIISAKFQKKILVLMSSIQTMPAGNYRNNILQKHIENPVKHLRRSVLQKCKNLHLRCLTGFCTSLWIILFLEKPKMNQGIQEWTK